MKTFSSSANSTYVKLKKIHLNICFHFFLFPVYKHIILKQHSSSSLLKSSYTTEVVLFLRGAGLALHSS